MRSRTTARMAIAMAVLLALTGLATLAADKGAGEPAAKTLPIESWLVAGPAPAPPFAFGEMPKKEFVERLLGTEGLSPALAWPKAGDTMAWLPDAAVNWRTAEAKNGRLELAATDKGTSVTYAATYLDAPRWVTAVLSVKSGMPVAVYLDGKQVARRADADGETPAETTADLVLPRGLHRLLVTCVLNSGNDGTVDVVLRQPSASNLPLPSVTLESGHPLSQEDALSADFIQDLALSEDGSKVASVVRKTDLAADKRTTYVEVRDTRTGDLQADMEVAQGTKAPYFSPDGGSVAFLAPNVDDKETEDLWLMNLGRRSMERLLEGQRGVKDLLWSKDGAFLYFIATAPRERPKTPPPWLHFTQMVQRWSDWEDKAQVFVLSMKDRSLHQLTAGLTSVQDMAISPDGTTLALLRTVAVTRRPYLIAEVWTYRIADGAARRVLRWRRWPDTSELAFSPDGRHLALVSSLSDMDPGGTKPVEHLAYNFGLYVIDLPSGTPRLITKGFKPSVGSQLIGALPGRRSVWWTPSGAIYFIATEGSTLRLYKTDGRGSAFAAADLPDTSLGSPDMAASGAGLAYLGSSFTSFPTLRFYDTATGRTRSLDRPGGAIYDRVTLGKTERFDFTNKRGVSIEGWLLFPPGFDAHKKYPVIFAYYGGVVPYGQAFRPELIWLAGQGYLVYLVNPEGAVGYGVEYADAHMNDWGQKAGEDLLEGLDKLLKEKPYADAAHVGCYGGSYGDFMTLWLAGHSDRFAAAVDFFGISDITSYWGAGWWGFSYGDTAIANSYPWSRRDVFVNQSPVYFADKIHAPLLLLHGDSDVNVPYEESDQIFTALRVLGRTCEYVRFAGENHGLHGKPSNDYASDRMMLEWFDKYLKGQGEAWEYRWKDERSGVEEEAKP